MATPQPGAPDIHVFEMRIKIEERDERLRPGMSAEVEITLKKLPDALSVPLEAIFHHGHGDKNIVYRREGRSFQPVEVTLGPRNQTAVVIRTGLSEGDVIALQNPHPR